MSLNTAIQQISSGAASLAAGAILVLGADGRFQRYGLVGWMAAVGMLASIWLGRGLIAQDSGKSG
jgi:hypothetical protein